MEELRDFYASLYIIWRNKAWITQGYDKYMQKCCRETRREGLVCEKQVHKAGQQQTNLWQNGMSGGWLI